VLATEEKALSACEPTRRISADHQDQNHCQHYCTLGDILPAVVSQNLGGYSFLCNPFNRENSDFRLDNGWIIGTRPLFEALIDDLARNQPVSKISRKFHDGLIEVFGRIAGLLREHTTLNRICLSGGTFHNVYLHENLNQRLASQRFEVFKHSEVPPGDGGLSLGQAMVAAHCDRR
jgi:hydrogenase maturation factor HypF (carbamoyltransferase family)